MKMQHVPQELRARLGHSSSNTVELRTRTVSVRSLRLHLQTVSISLPRGTYAAE
jgi:hypothetical protein